MHQLSGIEVADPKWFGIFVAFFGMGSDKTIRGFRPLQDDVGPFFLM
jgi:hypothetical protein